MKESRDWTGSSVLEHVGSSTEWKAACARDRFHSRRKKGRGFKFKYGDLVIRFDLSCRQKFPSDCFCFLRKTGIREVLRSVKWR